MLRQVNVSTRQTFRTGDESSGYMPGKTLEKKCSKLANVKLGIKPKFISLGFCFHQSRNSFENAMHCLQCVLTDDLETNDHSSKLL